MAIHLRQLFYRRKRVVNELHKCRDRKTCYYKMEGLDLNANSPFYNLVNATPGWIYGVGR